MTAARPLPELGSIHLDARGAERALRVSWHTEQDLVVLSMWRDNVCAASFRLSAADVPALIEVLESGLAVLDLAPDHAGAPPETAPISARPLHRHDSA